MIDTWSRVTVLGQTRRANLVLPAQAPIGSLIAELVALLGEPESSTPEALTLVTSTGQLIQPENSLAGVGIADGAILHLIRQSAAPPPPVVGDITEETVADLDQRAGRWSPTARAITAVTVAILAAATAGLQVVLGHPTRSIGIALAVVAALLWTATVTFGALRRSWAATASGGAGWALGGAAIIAFAKVGPWMWTTAALATTVLGWSAVGLIGRFAWRARGPVIGASTGVVLTGGWLLLDQSRLSSGESLALVAIASALVLGVLPRIALSLSGLTALDDQQVDGRPVGRRNLTGSLTAAHAGLTWGVVAVAAVAAATSVGLAITGGAWEEGLAGAVAAVVTLRARNFPLVVEVVAILASAAVISIAMLAQWSVRYPTERAIPIVIAAATAAIVVAGNELRIPEHTSARLRQLADRSEGLAVLAIVPCTVGVFGVFDRLLNTF